MKKKLLSICLALDTGVVLAIPVLTLKIEKKNVQETEVFVLQTGVFANYQNALEKQSEVPEAIILEDKGLYRVIVGASSLETGLEKIEKLLQSRDIHYYKKKITILEENLALFEEYNTLLNNASSDEVVLLLNQKILESMMQDEV